MNKTVHIPGFNLRITRRLILDLSLHVIVSVLLAIIAYTYTRNILWPLLVLLGGILIDIDHFLDYFLHLDKWCLHSFLHGKFVSSGKLYLIFHAWELVILFAFLGIFWPLFFPLALGMTGHLTIDKIMHARKSLLSYFILYRWKHGFLFNKFNYYQFEKQMKSLREAGLLDEKQKTDKKTQENM
jgi:hypothetical protein